MFRFATTCGLKQRVKAPTRGKHLLDLLLSDLDPAGVNVLNMIADHNIVLAKFNFGVPESLSVSRIVFDYNKADWEHLQNAICGHDWAPIDSMDVNLAERFFHTTVMTLLERYIPTKRIEDKKSAHPWVNEQCLAAVRRKNESSGTDEFPAAASLCSTILFN